MQKRKIVVAILISILLIGMATQGVIAKEIGMEEQLDDSRIEDSSSSATVPSTQIYTGCLTTVSRWGMPKGVAYYLRIGTTPAGTCLSGDITISFVKTSYINTLQSRLTKLEQLLSGVTRSGNNIYINRANLWIRDGSGSTDGAVNGLGNLIIGYNEPRSTGNVRTGSHNLILGKAQNYDSYGGIDAGYFNFISAPYASITGGTVNVAEGSYSTISGGNENNVWDTGKYGTVSGGRGNTARGESSSVSGGRFNTVIGIYSSISGGIDNGAWGNGASVSGGLSNAAGTLATPGSYESISGGNNNVATGYYSSITGGNNNLASGSWSSVGGGDSHSALGDYDWVAGGLFQDT